MDGPIVQFEEKFNQLWQLRYPELPFVPLEERVGLKMELNYPMEFRQMIKDLICEDYFARDLKPTPGAIVAINQMMEMGHEVHVCTSPLRNSDTNASDKFAWIKTHFGYKFTENVTVTSDKTLMIGDVLIDDNPDVSVGGAIPIPVWKHLLFEVSHNKHVRKEHETVNWTNWLEKIEKVCR